MKQVILNVKDENLDTLMTILENLKMGLIEKIEYDGKKQMVSRYQPKQNGVVKEGQMPGGKYISRDEYQRRKSGNN